MPLTADGYKKLTTQALSATDLPGVLDGIYTAASLSSWVMPSGSRTQGVGAAWTWARYQNGGVTEAVYAIKSQPGGFYLCVVFAGAKSGTHSSVQMAQGAYANGQLLMGYWCGTTSPTYSSWDGTTPITGTGYWMGYHPHSSIGTGASSSFDRVALYEAAEQLLLDIGQSSGGSISRGFAGAIIEPNTTTTAGTLIETNGRIYGQNTLGTTALMATSYLDGNNSTGRLLYQHTTGNATVPMFRFKQAAAGSASSYGAFAGTPVGAISHSFTIVKGKNSLSEPIRFPLQISRYTGNLDNVGAMRSVWATYGGATHGPYSDSNNISFILHASTSTNGDGMAVLMAAA